jgi:hypothetical protein
MSRSDNPSHGRLALAISVGGFLLACFVGMIANMLEPEPKNSMAAVAFGIFVLSQIAAFLLGLTSRGEALGKAACTTSALFGVGSLLLLS